MKKTYIQPAITIVKTATESPIMAGSTLTTSISSGTTTTVGVRRDPGLDDWEYWDEEEE